MPDAPNTMLPMADVTLHHVTRTFGATRAVDDVSLQVEHGELFFLLGPSGCGKTTLLRLLAGFIEPEGGSIHFGAVDVTQVPPEKRGAAMVFQSYALWPHMTVHDNVAFGLTVRKTPAAETARRVAEALTSVHLENYGGRKPSELSGGQQQRTALARAIVVKPDVLLLDEPLSNLDAKLRIETRQEIRRLCKSAEITAVYVTHDQKEALSIGDRMAVMRDGTVVQVGTPRDLYSRPVNRFIADFLGESNFLPGTRRQVREGQLEVETPIGTLRVQGQCEGKTGAKTVVLIRPSAISLAGAGSSGGSSGVNTVDAWVAGSTYLGEMTQFTVKTQGGCVLTVDVLNAPPLADGSQVRLEIRPESVVLLPDDQ